MSKDKYYLFEYIETNEGKELIGSKGFDNIEIALEAFNHDLEGNFLNAPILGHFPEAFIIKGIKIPIKIKKLGIIESEALEGDE